MNAIVAKLISLVMSAIVLMLQGSIGGLLKSGNINDNEYGKVKPDSWAAVDSLGRTLPSYEEVGERDSEKFVGMFYWVWHYPFAQGFPARNVTEILKRNPTAVNDFSDPIWENTDSGTPYYWDEPLLGYYSNLDEYVVRKHAEMIADAGVDVIIFDCTNGTEIWEEGCETLFRVFEEARGEGVNVPQIAFMLPFSSGDNSKTSLTNLYNNIYSKGRYSDLWFMWDGKPLIMAYPGSLDKKVSAEREISSFFTFRQNEPSYFSSDTAKYEGVWGWCSSYPQTEFGKTVTGVEQMCVSVAQNAADGKLTAMNTPGVQVQGRSFAFDGYSYTYTKDGAEFTVDENTDNSVCYGLNFQQQWDYAIECDPDFIFVTGWNEWIAGRHSEWLGTENAFPDEFSPEYSRDIEPSAGELKDCYYYQLVANIRRYKGVNEYDTSCAKKTIDIYGGETQWGGISSVFYHYTGSTRARSCDGWQTLHYTSDTMRNDFRSVKTAYDDNYIYLRIETVDAITPYTDSAWMRLLIDTDASGASPNWEGFEYIINRDGASESTVSVEKSTGGWSFTKTGTADYTVKGNVMVIRVPRDAIGMTDDVCFNFKLSDNMQADGDILDFYKNGDVAPGGRFMFCVKN